VTFTLELFSVSVCGCVIWFLCVVAGVLFLQEQRERVRLRVGQAAARAGPMQDPGAGPHLLAVLCRHRFQSTLLRPLLKNMFQQNSFMNSQKISKLFMLIGT